MSSCMVVYLLFCWICVPLKCWLQNPTTFQWSSVGVILVRLIVLIFHEVLVEIVNLVCPTVEDFLGFLRRLTIEAQAVLLKGGKGGD